MEESRERVGGAEGEGWRSQGRGLEESRERVGGAEGEGWRS